MSMAEGLLALFTLEFPCAHDDSRHTMPSTADCPYMKQGLMHGTGQI